MWSFHKKMVELKISRIKRQLPATLFFDPIVNLGNPDNHTFLKVYKYVIQYRVLPAFISDTLYAALVYFYFDRFISSTVYYRRLSVTRFMRLWFIFDNYSPMPPIASFLNYSLMIFSVGPSALIFIVKRFEKYCKTVSWWITKVGP